MTLTMRPAARTGNVPALSCVSLCKFLLSRQKSAGQTPIIGNARRYTELAESGIVGRWTDDGL